MLYGYSNSSILVANHNLIFSCLIKPSADSEYASINPGIPNFIPPKYLTTNTATLIILCLLRIFNIGGPEEPLGSPASALKSFVLISFSNVKPLNSLYA